MNQISRMELIARLACLRGAKIIGLKIQGDDPARRKADRGRVTKVSEFSVMLNARYDRAKAKRLNTDVESVEIQQVPWRERIADTPLLKHKTNGTQYLESLFLSGHTHYTLDGQECDRKAVADIIKGGNSTNKPPVPWRTPKVENILAVTIDGETMEVVD